MDESYNLKIERKDEKFMGKINEKQKIFCYEYIKDLNATQAAMRAGYSSKYSGKIGHELLTKPHVKEFIEILKSESTESTNSEIENIISECKVIAFSSIDGEIIKTSDKLKSLEMLGKYLGLFSERSKEPMPDPIVQIFFEDKTGDKEFT